MRRSTTKNTCGCGRCAVCIKFAMQERELAWNREYRKRKRLQARNGIHKRIFSVPAVHVKRILALSPHERAAYIRKLAKHCGVTVKTVYCWLQKNVLAWDQRRRIEIETHG